jgi:hypothetical protein
LAPPTSRSVGYWLPEHRLHAASPGQKAVRREDRAGKTE